MPSTEFVPNELLRRELISWIHARGKASKSIIVGEFAKAPARRTTLQKWMNERVFDGSTWGELLTHERKYILRLHLAALVSIGALVYETELRVARPLRVMRVGTVLDILASIAPK